ncbi:hypothetical protein [Paenibacillus sp. alder61]|nr:hypothetical protein [Paenibacillus sp. alder61]
MGFHSCRPTKVLPISGVSAAGCAEELDRTPTEAMEPEESLKG